MANKSPIFSICEPQHFSDYGFDTQINYFQIMEEAKRHKMGTCNYKSSSARYSLSSIDALHFKLQKPISKEEIFAKKKIKKKRWWRNALHFFKGNHRRGGGTGSGNGGDSVIGYGVPYCSGRLVFRGSISGPIYITESRSGSSTPYRTTCSRPTSGPLAGTLTPVEKDEVQIPYISLRDFELDHHHHHRFSTSSAMPIYLVT